MKTILVLDAFPPSLKETVIASVPVVRHICITIAQTVLREVFFFFVFFLLQFTNI